MKCLASVFPLVAFKLLLLLCMASVAAGSFYCQGCSVTLCDLKVCHCWVHLKVFLCIRIANLECTNLQVWGCLSVPGKFVEPAYFQGAWRAYEKALELVSCLGKLGIWGKLWDTLIEVKLRGDIESPGKELVLRAEGGRWDELPRTEPSSHQRRKEILSVDLWWSHLLPAQTQTLMAGS